MSIHMIAMCSRCEVNASIVRASPVGLNVFDRHETAPGEGASAVLQQPQ